MCTKSPKNEPPEEETPEELSLEMESLEELSHEKKKGTWKSWDLDTLCKYKRNMR